MKKYYPQFVICMASLVTIEIMGGQDELTLVRSLLIAASTILLCAIEYTTRKMFEEEDQKK